MVSIQNINSTQSPTIVSKLPKGAKNLSFNAESDQYVRQNKQPVYTQPPILDQQAAMRRAIEEQQKAQKKQKLKQNLSWGLGIAVSMTFLAVLLPQVFGKGAAKKEMDDLAKVVINWVDKKGQKTHPSLSSPTTSETVANEFQKFIKRTKMSSAKIKRSGSKQRARLILLHGPSGTGKTFVTEQLAQDQEAIYACIKYSDIASPFKDAAGMKISNCFEKGVGEMATKHPDRPIVLCVDEADTVLRKVNDLAQGAEEAGKSRGVFLAAADNIVRKYPNVTIIFTTNYSPQSGQLSKAAIRRIPYKIEVGLPTYKQADALGKLYLKDCEGLSKEFFESGEYKDFIQKLVDEKYGSGEIKNIMEMACDKYLYRLDEVADEKIGEVFFEMQDLHEAKKLVGRAVESLEGAGV